MEPLDDDGWVVLPPHQGTLAPTPAPNTTQVESPCL